MINMSDIEKEIRELESNGCTSMKNCSNLATLYIIREFCGNDKPLSLQTFARRNGRTGDPGERIMSGTHYNNQMFAHTKDYKDKLSKDEIAMVMDSTLDALKDVNPAAYNSAIEMLNTMVSSRR